ncbi:AaceriAFR032Wp [[Ashbya] aceris (nom. inval.)]|nr:AaceriAFR032Wp [[Ashbya] aceris (nom. inval.)]
MSQSVARCPQCNTELRKCLIQQNYSIVICPNEQCMYPFNEAEVIQHLVQTSDKEILEAAKVRLKNDNITGSGGALME